MAQPRHTGDYVRVQTDIDRKKYGKRTVPMKVLQLGLGRTGTESTARAIEMLGINECYHGWDPIFGNPRDMEMWQEALEAKFDGKGKLYGREEFDKLLGHCQGVSDIPAILFSRELVEAYPEAKVILTHRNFETWYKSCSESLDVALAHPINFGVMQPLVMLFKRYDRWTRPTLLKTWQILFKGNFQVNARQVWHQHYDFVRSLVPPERLLEYNVKDGWEPLVTFLEVPHPRVPFPRGNTTEAALRRAESDVKQTFVYCMGRLFRFCFYTWLGYILLRRVKLLKGGQSIRKILQSLILRPC